MSEYKPKAEIVGRQRQANTSLNLEILDQMYFRDAELLLEIEKGETPETLAPDFGAGDPVLVREYLLRAQVTYAQKVADPEK